MAVCSNCHHPNAADAHFCESCGARLAAVQRREERKVITVLFADLVGFTSRVEHMDVEDVRAMLAPYYALLRQQLEQFGGTVEKFIGDAVMAVFGAPTAHEDDPERAVRSALAIREALAAANEENPELDLHVRIAVNSGEALVFVGARSDSGESISSGDVINTAARLQTGAPIDGVLVGTLTYRATCDVIDYAEAAPVEAKGKTEPIPCWEALRARSRVGESRRRQDATRLIGREGERQTLIDAFETARGTRSVGMLTLVGVAGIGKSRLVRELFHHIDRRPELVRWREGRSPPYGHGVTFWALGEIVKAEAGMVDSQESGLAASKLAAAVWAAIGERDEAEWVERHLRGLVGLEEGSVPFGDRRAEAFAAWRRFLEALAEARPTVLVFEDLHCADDALLDFIEHLLAWAAGVPLLVLCTARPELLERRPRWGGDAESTSVLSLAPLSEAETHDLLDALIPSSLLPPETRSALLAAAEGNPLYAQEFAGMLADRGGLQRRREQLVLEEIGELAVPDSVLGIIAARLDAAPAEEKAVIQDASVIGRVFWPGAIGAVADRSRWAIEESLRRLEQRQLVRRRHESSVAGDFEYVFEHALIRDVAYRTIVRPLRAEKHRRAAEWLSSLAGERRERADAIAHHYVTALENAEASGQATAELGRAASSALEAAAERAGSLNSHAAAARLWGRALELCAPDDARRARLLLSYGRALALADEPADAILDEAAAALVDAGDLRAAAEAQSTLGWLLSLAGRSEQARERDERALALARDAAPSHAKALILTRAAAHMVFVEGGRAEALGLLREALSISEALGLREMEAEALQFVGMARLDAGDGAGIEDIEKALAVATEFNSPVSLSCYGNLADMCRYLGSLQESSALHLRGERAAERFGIPVQVRRFRAEQACDLYYTGEWDESVAHVEAYLDAIQTGSPHRGAGEARLHRGRIRLARGEGPGALEDAEAALEFARRTGEPFNLFPALAFHTRASAERASERAEASLSELLDGLAAGQTFWAAWCLPDLLEGSASQERLDDLRRLLDAATPRSRWYDAASAVIAGDFAGAADLYAAMGSQPDEAVARLRAAEQRLAAGDEHQVEAQLAPALAFFARVGARTYMRHAETVAAR